MTDEQLAANYTKPETLTNDQLAAAISEEDLEIYIKFSYNNGADVWRNVLAEAARRVRGIRHQLGHGDFDETVRRAHVVCDMWEHYEHAREKHPYFCDELISSCLPSSYYEEVLNAERKALLTRQSINRITATSILSCELAEMNVEISRRKTAAAIEEAYDCIAVLLRVIDVLEERQKRGEPARRPEVAECKYRLVVEHDCRPATKNEIENGKAAWCHACQSACINRGKDALVACDGYEPPEQEGAMK